MAIIVLVCGNDAICDYVIGSVDIEVLVAIEKIRVLEVVDFSEQSTVVTIDDAYGFGEIL